MNKMSQIKKRNIAIIFVGSIVLLTSNVLTRGLLNQNIDILLLGPMYGSFPWSYPFWDCIFMACLNDSKEYFAILAETVIVIGCSLNITLAYILVFLARIKTPNQSLNSTPKNGTN